MINGMGNGLLGLQPLAGKTVDSGVQEPVGAAEMTQNFGSFLNKAIQDVADQGTQVNQLTEKFMKGELNDVSQLTIAMEKASVGLELTVQVRNKVLEAYQEMMRIQI